MKKLLIVVSILCFFASTASADWERTICAWDTRLPDKEKLQLSLWSGYWTYEDEGADGNEFDSTFYVNYGIEDDWSVCIAPSISRWDVDGGDSEAGISDTLLMTTYRFLDEAEDDLDMAVMGRLSLPTGDDDKGLGSGSVEPGIALLVSREIGEIIGVANLGTDIIIDADDGEEDLLLWTSFEGVYPLNDEWNLNATFNFATARWEDGDNLCDLGFGARFTPEDEQMFVGGAVYVSLTDNYDAGFQIAFGYEF